MATESDVTVGSRWQWNGVRALAPFTYVEKNKVRYDDDAPGRTWHQLPETIAAQATLLRAAPLPAAAAEKPAVECAHYGRFKIDDATPWRCGSCNKDVDGPGPTVKLPPAAETSTVVRDPRNPCGHEGLDICSNCAVKRWPSFARRVRREPPAPRPPRCLRSCTPFTPCRTLSVCPVFLEEDLAQSKRHRGVPSDIPPAREPRIGALSWSHATACGGLSTRRGR